MPITGKSIFCATFSCVCSNCLMVLIIICLETFDVALPNGYNKIKETVKSDLFVHPHRVVLCILFSVYV